MTTPALKTCPIIMRGDVLCGRPSARGDPRCKRHGGVAPRVESPAQMSPEDANRRLVEILAPKEEKR